MVLSFLDYESVDPIDSPRAVAAALASAKDYMKRTGARDFLFHADSVEEFDVRAEVKDIGVLLDTASAGLGDDGREVLMASLRREFEAASCKCKAGEECVCKGGECKCVKVSNVRVANKYIKHRG